MKMCDIKKLATLLRKNGDSICCGKTLLVLTVPVLQELNESLLLVCEHVQTTQEYTIQVPLDTIVEQHVLDDLNFLLNLIQKTPGLRLVSSNIIHQPDGETPSISIEHFRSLKDLVLHKVRLSDVQGLSGLGPQLLTLSCDSDPEPLLRSISVWPRMQKASFCHARMTAVPSSLATALPCLTILDLSRNRLSNTADIDFSVFQTLRRLSLAYNLFETVPIPLPPRLQALGLGCNYIDSVEGISSAEMLQELDLSGNCLPEHSCLEPLSCLPALQWLDLHGNPLAFHPRHRALTAARLHTSSLFCQFVLDGQQLSETECLTGHAGRNAKKYIKPTSLIEVPMIVEQPAPIQVRRTPPEDTMSSRSSTASDKTLIADDMPLGVKDSNKDSKPSSGRKSRHVRKAVISDLDNVDTGEDSPLTKSITSIQSSPSPDTPAEHLETKRKVENLRQMFGHDNWLHSQGGTFLQDVLGLPPTTVTPTALLGTMTDTTVFLEHVDTAAENGSVASQVTKESQNIDMSPKEDGEQAENIYKDTAPANEISEDEERKEIIPLADEDEEEDENEQHLYTLRRIIPGKQRQQELFLVVTERQLKERDTISGRLLCRWQTDVLQSCELQSSEPAHIRLTFDTVRPDRKERTYVMEDVKDCQRLVQALRHILDQRPLQANKLSAFHCMKCSSQFSKEISSPMVPDSKMNVSLHCPNCGSVVVVQTDEELKRVTAVSAPVVPAGDDSHLTKSPSQSSIGSAASLDTSGEPSASTVLSGGGNGAARRYESDIEIISNPSQSSIEVLDSTGARTPGRKRSSEERQTALAATQGTHTLLPNVPLPMTESSSSDSLTDSVCTAYEGRHPPELASASILTSQLGHPAPGHTTTLQACAEPNPGYLQRLPPQPNENKQHGISPDVPQYSFVDFTLVDHRIKLHLYVTVFQKQDEELTTLVKVSVLNKNMTHPKPSLVVFSTYKIYLLHITRHENDEPQQWLALAESWPLQQLKEVRVLPWVQGLMLSTSAPVVMLLLLHDTGRTSALLSHLKGLEISNWCQFEQEPLKQHTEAVERLGVSADDLPPNVRVAVFFVSATITTDSGTSDLGIGLLVVSESALIVTTDSLLWLLPSTRKQPEIATVQSISNLVEVEVNDEVLTPVFLDETSGTAREVRWTLKMGTSAAVASLLDAVRPPWEQLFSLPLQVSVAGQ